MSTGFEACPALPRFSRNIVHPLHTTRPRNVILGSIVQLNSAACRLTMQFQPVHTLQTNLDDLHYPSRMSASFRISGKEFPACRDILEDGERNLVSVEKQSSLPDDFKWKLWIYTNYDCNLQCSYCVAESSPYTPPRPISLETVRRLVDEAVAQGFSCVYFTGGEPLILEDIYSMLSYSSRSLPTVLLTNAMLLDKNRLEKLCAVNNDQLVIQVSLDGGHAEHHDVYRGPEPGRARLPASAPSRLTGCMCVFLQPRPGQLCPPG